MSEVPDTRYAKTKDGVHIAYQVLGDGPRDLVYVPRWPSHLDWAWEYPPFARMLRRLASFSRLIWFDKRGSGLSDRPERLPTLEDQMEDLGAVMDAAGSERAVLFGDGEGVAQSIMYAATHPDRVEGLITFGGRARLLRSADYPWGMTEESYTALMNHVEANWGQDDPEAVAFIAPSMADDIVFRKWHAQYRRLSASPSGIIELGRILSLHDIRSILPAVRVPTINLVRTDMGRLGDVRYMTDHIPGATLIELEGRDVLIHVGNTDAVIDEVQEFMTGVRDAADIDRVLATVLMTDIVGSTELAASLGDRKWTALLDAHDKVIDHQLERFRGRKVNPTGDGMLATFDGPARAIRCAKAMIDETHAIAIDIRAGLHSGEIELRGDDIGGIGVHIGARVASLAEAGEVLVSRTVVDLVAGSGITFEERGEHTLRGVPGSWQIFAVGV